MINIAKSLLLVVIFFCTIILAPSYADADNLTVEQMLADRLAHLTANEIYTKKISYMYSEERYNLVIQCATGAKIKDCMSLFQPDVTIPAHVLFNFSTIKDYPGCYILSTDFLTPWHYRGHGYSEWYYVINPAKFVR